MFDIVIGGDGLGVGSWSGRPSQGEVLEKLFRSMVIGSGS